ncbi:MAG: LAGLIDADG family homing endonuclease [Vicingaceae bacterium]
MNWNYISGFFDADGSITLSNPGNSKYKTVFVSFHNNELSILESIKRFIEKETGVKGVIVKKKARLKKHNTAYDLKYDFLPKVITIINYLKIQHPKKIHRIKVAKQLAKIVPRNGKYTNDLLVKRKELEEIFFEC